MQTPAIFVGLTEQERAFVVAYAARGDAEASKRDARYQDTTTGQHLLRRPHIALAVRAEIRRLFATEGAQISYRSLKRIALDEKAPAAAQVAAAKALAQAAGLLDAPTDQKETKSINDMTREELHTYIESKRADIDKMEAALADRAQDITPNTNTQAPDLLD